MSKDQGTLERVGRQLTLAMAPLRDAVSDPERFKQFMARLGWSPNDLPPAWTNLGNAVDTAVSTLQALPDSPSPGQVLDLIDAVKAAYEAIRAINVAPAGVDAGAFVTEIGERVFELLLTDHLVAELPGAFNLLSTFDVIQSVPRPAEPGRPSFIRLNFNWANLPKIVSEPGTLPQRVYGWGTPAFRFDRLLDDVSGLFEALDFPVQLRAPESDLVRRYADITTGGVTPPSAKSLIVPFFYFTHNGKEFEAAFVLRHLPAANGKPPGIVLEPHIPPEFGSTLRLSDTIDLRVRAGTNVATLIGLTIRPGEIQLKLPFAPGTAPPSAGLGVGFDFHPKDSVVILGNRGASRLEFKGAAADFSATSVNGQFEVLLSAELKGLAFVLQGGEGDGFIQKIIGTGATRIEIPLGIEWSNRFGIRFRGSAAFEVSVHPHLSLGPIRIDEVTVRVALPSPAPPDTRIEIGAGITGTLGPLTFFVQGIGLSADFTFAPGNVGPFDLQPRFKPPNGIGLSIDGGGFKGGGFLIFDSARGEYAGGLELEFAELISVRAVGILSTKMPDGSNGFSLLIIIVAEFIPIQLGFGFTLIGVGGLLGLNRTVISDVLRQGVRDGSLNSVLFPRDVVANAPRIINDLKRIFPPLDGRFLIGPMAKLGWGTPTMISLELGLLLEIPEPIFRILGVLRVNVPAEDVALLHLQVNFFGEVDFAKQQLSFDASLFDSRLLAFTLTGDLAVRLYWGENANFLLSAGGFHPAYTPPPMGLGPLRRMGMVLFQGNPSVRAEAYFAVTSNTVQFGARVEMMYGIDLFNVYGFLSLDVLIQFDPFRFIAEISGMIAVRSGTSVLFCIRIDLTLSGPTPWNARGRGSFKIGFIIKITISVRFDVTVGEERHTALPPIDVLPRLRDALAQDGNWRAIVPAQSHQQVTTREIPVQENVLVLHPSGALEISQKVVPLHLDISRFGTTTPQAGKNFTIAEVRLGAAVTSTENKKEQFAPAQFIEMSDAEKLSRRSFEEYDAGVKVGSGDRPRADFFRKLQVVYEVIYMPKRHSRLFHYLRDLAFSSFALSSAAAKSTLSARALEPSGLGTDKVKVQPEVYAVASSNDLALHDSAFVFASEAEAHAALAALTDNRPEVGLELQVIPLSQVRRS